MAKNIKINVKNVQIAEALKLGGLKDKLKKKLGPSIEAESQSGETEAEAEVESKETKKASKASPKLPKKTKKAETTEAEPVEETPRIKARSKSAFVEPVAPNQIQEFIEEAAPVEAPSVSVEEPVPLEEPPIVALPQVEEVKLAPKVEDKPVEVTPLTPQVEAIRQETPPVKEVVKPITSPMKEKVPPPRWPAPAPKLYPSIVKPAKAPPPPMMSMPMRSKLGPTGRHVRDLLPPPPPPPAPPLPRSEAKRKIDQPAPPKVQEIASTDDRKNRVKSPRAVVGTKELAELEEELGRSKKGSKPKFKEFKDVKPLKRKESQRFDARDRQGLRDGEDESEWRKRRSSKSAIVEEEEQTSRPTQLSIRLPIRIKDLAIQMKLKASELVSKLFLSGVMLTLNDFLDDETTVQLLGHELGCELTIDTTEEKRIQITDKNIKEEILQTAPESLSLRPPVVAFMGHVDHGKTSLIDAIRSSNRAAGEAGAITQHIGAFRTHTAVGDITVLDTPGHEAFSAMRARGADVTDIVVLVVAGDEGMRQQTLEAIQHARAANVTIIVAINKCDKPNFNAENVYRQLADQNLLPEAWGGATVTVNCSATTGEGIKNLLEMLALQAEVLELKANSSSRARGSVLESELHKGLGIVSTILVQNGTLRPGDALVFGQAWGRVKTMRDEFGKNLKEAGPSTPVQITGLSALPKAGEEFIAVSDEKEARLIAEARSAEMKETALQKSGRGSMENLFQEAAGAEKKVLNIILRADVQGSLEALRVALQKIESTKADLNIIFAGVGEISESDVQLAAASKAMILGFHTQVESHAELLIKQYDIKVRLHDIIYHAIDDVKEILTGMLDKLAEEHEKGKALVKAVFKSSQAGRIAGCEVTEGSIHRSNHIRIMRSGRQVWKGSLHSLRRVKDDVREVAKGLECGIVLNGFNDISEGDILEAYEVIYITQQL